ncbi:hypothetical protein EYC80_006563 [Monilinia laxa]|uniref:Uncharacterized protein n=1 Tax=Monilinia laxa TaxID=61186 RepID=A0A5N6JSB2_MONLA|nr:hypothetical protein EYC80_006563 [Monilinia laxa]
MAKLVCKEENVGETSTAKNKRLADSIQKGSKSSIDLLLIQIPDIHNFLIQEPSILPKDYLKNIHQHAFRTTSRRATNPIRSSYELRERWYRDATTRKTSLFL